MEDAPRIAPTNVFLQLQVDPDSEPISGLLVYPDGHELAFAGWIELTAALEDARHPLDVLAHGNTVSDTGSEPPGNNRTEPGEERP